MMKEDFSSIEWIALGKRIRSQLLFETITNILFIAKYVVKRKERVPSSEPIVPLILEPLHEDLAVNIIRHLPDEDLCLYATVSKTWYKYERVNIVYVLLLTIITLDCATRRLFGRPVSERNSTCLLTIHRWPKVCTGHIMPHNDMCNF